MYELFDFENNSISFDELDDKAFWCAHGEQQEKAFINVFKKLQRSGSIDNKYNASIHPEKEINPYHPDLLINENLVGDVKIKNSPLFMARSYSVSPQFALTIDLKDIFNYRKRLLTKNQDILIFVWVKWEAHKMVTQFNTYSVNKMGGIWVSTISKLLSFLENNKVGIHWYKERFRHPKFFDTNHPWAKELLGFEKRLLIDGSVKNITSNGFICKGEQSITYPSGHSSCSYVLDLSDKNLFENLFLKM